MLDPVCVDELDDHRCGRSRPAAKKADALFRIAFARRSSRFSRSNSDDLVAVSLLGAGVPGDVALELLEGDLGADIGWHLEQIPPDVGIGDPAALALLDASSSARMAQDLLAEPPGLDVAVAGTLLARKRPRLLPVDDRVVRCALGSPTDL